MKFLSWKSLAATGALSVAGLGLIGMGAHATFTVSPNANQVISTGTLAVNASSPADASCPNSGAGCTSITLPSSTNNGSTFSTGPQEIVLTNVGSLSAYWTGVTVTNGDGANAFSDEAYLCLTDSNGNVMYNGPFWEASVSEHDSIPTSPPGDNEVIAYANVYAGDISTACGAVTEMGQLGVAGANPAAASLTNAAMGESIDPTFAFTFTA